MTRRQKHELRAPGILRGVVFAAGLLLAIHMPFDAARAGGESELYAFTGTSGNQPQGPLIADTAGNLYGTTNLGGASGYEASGTVFKLAPDGTQTVLYSFSGGKDGGGPAGGVIADKKGNLYGTTSGGGPAGKGVVFKLTPSGKERVLYAFTDGSDGYEPFAGLLADKQGNLYGTTTLGGTFGGNNECSITGCGVVFKLTPGGTETVLYSFSGGADGALPSANLIADAQGNLYSTTATGGTHGYGTVFKLSPGGTETVLYSFTGGNDGAYPESGLLMDKAGNLYGTTSQGGTAGDGTVFVLAANGTETVLHSFAGGSDGIAPYGGVIADTKGNLYGATFEGGSQNCAGLYQGCGVVFEVTPGGSETVLYSFTGGTAGSNPWGSLLMRGSELYGTATVGGITSDCSDAGCGTMFELKK